ncbi:hypothetical protein GW17_00034739 [Ensete ventricosum]|nr:hypothetical protein GW17_00034739 [Ensete ventricosum]
MQGNLDTAPDVRCTSSISSDPISFPSPKASAAKRGERKKREVESQGAEDAAESCEQCVLVVVGEPHPDEAVEMARQQPPRFCLLFN